MTRRARCRLAVAARRGLLAGCAPIPLPRATRPTIRRMPTLGVTRVVHGTFVLELHGTRLLLDPWFHSGMSSSASASRSA